MYKLIISTLLLALSTTNYAACKSVITRTAPDSRYELLNSNTEVKDTQTGLIWQRCSLGQTWSGTNCTGTAGTYNWTNALQTAKNIGNGWRVPNINELGSLIELACASPSINETYFPNTKSFSYLSSSTLAASTDYAWIVYFAQGNYNGFPKNNYNGYVRLVRSGQ